MRRLLELAASRFEALARILTYSAGSLLSLEELRASQDEYWASFGMDDDDIERGWFAWERSVADRFVCPGAHVLLVGCGSGRDLLPFLRHGCRVSAVEPSARPFERARRTVAAHGLNAEFLPGRIEEVSLHGSYDIVWFSWLSYSYIPGVRHRIATLQRCAERLSTSGCMVLNVLRRPPRNSANRIGAAVGRLFRRNWRLEPGDVLARQPGGSRYHFQHCFGAGELERELAAAGLMVVDRLDEDDVVVAGRVPVAPAVATVSAVAAADYPVIAG